VIVRLGISIVASLNEVAFHNDGSRSLWFYVQVF
jgi:hypothetical protein